MRRALALLAVLSLGAAGAARAGGDFVDLAVSGGRVWVVGEPGVRELDARTGRVLAAPRAAGAYPLSVALAGGAAWVATVENGYVDGTLTRIDLRTRRSRVVRRGAGSVQQVAAGGDGVWALVGSAHGSEVARFAADGRLALVRRVPGAGRIAADADGCWILTGRRLLRLDPAGGLHRIVRTPLYALATGGGAAWVARATSVLRIDERTGRVRTLVTGRLRGGGFQHDLAVGAGALWTLAEGTAYGRSTVVRRDARTGRATGRARVPGIADAIAVTSKAVWVATVLAPRGHVATGYDVVRLDPRSLRRTLLVRLR